ncbi:hypothetical protein PSDVSF_20480 [Pseudodesulfovibrio sediminis]|uniref:Integrase catalytic domain-containing protein n=1 Tax=Pseudodesulfovibrio sediminis TaxID=2810563 RepID=A0ABM9SDY0_9BACT|nr:hypothetical protein PSDVSF_20480 [Pseudodesulfovibrio sediminis]
MNNQTSIVGKEQVDIRVEKNTHVEGAVIAAENDNIKLDTNTLTYKDIYDHDKASSYQASLSGSLSAENEKDSETRKDGEEGNPYSGTLEGNSSSHDRRQINRATIGEGEIIIRSDPVAGLEGLNRDLAKAQEITRNEKTSVTVYIDSAAIEVVINGGEGIKNNFKNTVDAIKKLLPHKAIRKWLEDVGVNTAYIEPGSPWENGYSESFNEDELLNGEIFYSLKKAQGVIENWRQEYNTIRPHRSMGYKPPAPVARLPLGRRKTSAQRVLD